MPYLKNSMFEFYKGFSFYLLLYFAFSEGVPLTGWRVLYTGYYLLLSIILNAFIRYGYFIYKGKSNIWLPSGYAQVFSLISMLSAIATINYEESNQKTFYKLSLLLAVTIGAFYEGIHIKYHAYPQILFGALIGIGMALLISKYGGNPFTFSRGKDIHDKVKHEEREIRTSK